MATSPSSHILPVSLTAGHSVLLFVCLQNPKLFCCFCSLFIKFLQLKKKNPCDPVSRRECLKKNLIASVLGVSCVCQAWDPSSCVLCIHGKRDSIISFVFFHICFMLQTREVSYIPKGGGGEHERVLIAEEGRAVISLAQLTLPSR